MRWWAHWIVFRTSMCMYYTPCFVLVEHTVCHEPIFVLINVFMLLASCFLSTLFSVGSITVNAWTLALPVHSQHVVTKPLWWWGSWVLWIVFMTSLYMYYASCFLHVEQSVYHEPISALIDVFRLRFRA